MTEISGTAKYPRILQVRKLKIRSDSTNHDWTRAFANQSGRLGEHPAKRNRREPICFSPHLYRARNLVERFFTRSKNAGRVATRYDKLAANSLAFIQLASIRLWLRVNEPTP